MLARSCRVPRAPSVVAPRRMLRRGVVSRDAASLVAVASDQERHYIGTVCLHGALYLGSALLQASNTAATTSASVPRSRR